MDAAHEWTDREIKNLSERLRYHYRKAAKELGEKAEKSLEQYEKGNREMLKRLKAGEIDRAAYDSWLETQQVMQARSSAMIAELTESANNATREARAMIGAKMPEVYAENANFAAYSIDKAIKRDTSFSLLNKDTVLELMQKNPKLLPIPEPNYAKNTRWHSQKFTSALTQGVLQGESVQDIAKRLESVAGMDYDAALRAARTALTGAENRGRMSSYRRASKLGIKGVKRWIATHDGRTRDSHRELDGEEVGIEEEFSNRLMEPGDFDGEPSEVYNCRCSMRMIVDDVEPETLDQWSKLPDDVSYEDWKSGTYHTDKHGKETKASMKARGVE